MYDFYKNFIYLKEILVSPFKKFNFVIKIFHSVKKFILFK